MKELVENQQIKIKGFKFRTVITVHTLRHSFLEHKKDSNKFDFFKKMSWEDYKARNKSNNGSEFWALSHGSSITGDYTNKQKDFDLKRKQFDEAIELEDGEIVLIDNQKLKVLVMGEKYSDPIKFQII